MWLVDSHCHLNFADYAEDGVDKIIKNAEDNSVRVLLSIATDFNELGDVRKTAEKYPNVFAAFGIHPEYAKIIDAPSVEDLVSIIAHPKFIGVGETGLDFSFEEAASIDIQERLFRIHIEAARKSLVPVIVHARGAEEDTIRILQDEMKAAPFAGVLHCFTGSRKMAFKALDLGFYISVSGIITFGKNADDLRETIKALPLDRLLVETDAPFLSPAPFRGGRNEPAYVKYTAQRLADMKAMDFDELANVTTTNFFSLFQKAKYDNQ